MFSLAWKSRFSLKNVEIAAKPQKCISKNRLFWKQKIHPKKFIPEFFPGGGSNNYEILLRSMSKRKTPGNDDREEEPRAKIAPIFVPQAQRSRGVWKIIPDQLMIYTVEGIEHRGKVAGFDLDGTLIKTKSGRVFGRDSDDWQLWSDKVIGALRKCQFEGFKLCIFTNQKGIELKSVDAGQFKKKVQNICNAIALPIQVFISIGSPNYRKPYIGMWQRMEREENSGIAVNRKESFYVGDAAGRLKSSNLPKNDHSCADRLFAMNLSIKFYTPEQFFTKQLTEEPYRLPEFDPSTLTHQISQLDPTDALIPGPFQPEMVVLVGSPASGKSTFAHRYKHIYTILSQDELGSWEACVDRAREHLHQGRNVMIDNTNRNIEARRRYCKLAASLSLPCRCFHFGCSLTHAIHNNTFRQIIGADLPHKGVNEIAIRTYFSAYQEPTLEEGYSDIVRVNFVPEFENEEHRRIYGMYLAGK